MPIVAEKKVHISWWLLPALCCEDQIITNWFKHVNWLHQTPMTSTVTDGALCLQAWCNRRYISWMCNWQKKSSYKLDIYTLSIPLIWKGCGGEVRYTLDKSSVCLRETRHCEFNSTFMWQRKRNRTPRWLLINAWRCAYFLDDWMNCISQQCVHKKRHSCLSHHRLSQQTANGKGARLA